MSRQHPFFLHPECASDIVAIARAKVESSGLSPMFTSAPADLVACAADLAPVAKKLTDVQPADGATCAAALFTAEAFAHLVAKSANPYWFWYIVARIRTNHMPISLAAVARAHARAADSLHDNRYGFAFVKPACLEHQLKQLPPGFFAEMWHKGRIVAEASGSGEYRMQLNPLLVED